MAKTVYGLSNPAETAREVVARFIENVRANLGRMTENYRAGIRAAKDNPEKVRAMEQKLRVYYDTIASRYAEIAAVYVAAKYGLPYEEAREMIQAGVVRVV